VDLHAVDVTGNRQKLLKIFCGILHGQAAILARRFDLFDKRQFPDLVKVPVR
jgi:hypothetical protein